MVNISIVKLNAHHLNSNNIYASPFAYPYSPYLEIYAAHLYYKS